jgi:glutaminyl-tRNA synthetase
MIDPPKKFFRLSPGNEVRLKSAYIIKCEEVIRDENSGEILEIHCTYDPTTKSQHDTSGKKVKGTLHWVSIPHAVKAEVRLFNDLLLDVPMQIEGEEFSYEQKSIQSLVNPNSMEILPTCFVEPELLKAKQGDRFQFMRQGYFCLDTKLSLDDKLVFNQIVTLKDTWGKMEQSGKSNL